MAANAVMAETIELLKERLPSSLREALVDDLVIGIFFTGVKLSTGHAGVAFTPAGEIPEAVCCPTTAARMPQAGHLEGNSASEIMEYVLEANVLKSAIGVATVNAVSQAVFEGPAGSRYAMVEDTDGFDLLDIRPGETVSLVGAFGPYIRRLREMGNRFFIVEKHPETLRPDEMDLFVPEARLASAFDTSDAIIMTGTAIVNHTIDEVLAHINKGQRAAIIGPTASMLPDAFFARGVHVMAGVRVIDPGLMIKILKQGGSAYHLLHGCSEKIAFTRR